MSFRKNIQDAYTEELSQLANPDYFDGSDSEKERKMRSKAWDDIPKNKYNPLKDSSLHHAVREKHSEMTKRILYDGKHGVLENNNDKDETPISISASYWYGEAYDIFLNLAIHATKEIKNAKNESQSIITEKKLSVLSIFSKNITEELLYDLEDYARTIINRDNGTRIKNFFKIIGDKTQENNAVQLEIYKALLATEQSKNYRHLIWKIESVCKNNAKDIDPVLNSIIEKTIKEGNRLLIKHDETYSEEVDKFKAGKEEAKNKARTRYNLGVSINEENSEISTLKISLKKANEKIEVLEGIITESEKTRTKEREKDKADWEKEREKDKAEWEKEREKDKAEWEKEREKDKAEWEKEREKSKADREEDKKYYKEEVDDLKMAVKILMSKFDEKAESPTNIISPLNSPNNNNSTSIKKDGIRMFSSSSKSENDKTIPRSVLVNK